MPRLAPNRSALRPGRRVLALTAMALPLLLLGGCQTDHISFLAPAGPIAALQRHWFELLVAGLILVILPVLIGVPFCLWHYRAENRRATFRPDWDFALPLEFLVWGFPAVVVIAFSLLVWGPERRYSPEQPITDGAPLSVDVVALNWKWLFIYPDAHVASLDHLVLPKGREIVFHLTSDATMQSFLIPSLGSQIYAMAGMVTRLHLLADRQGRYLGENTQFNGMGFQDQKFAVDVVPPDQFKQFLTQASQSTLHLDTQTYDAVRKQENGRKTAQTLLHDSNATMASFSAVPDTFFHDIVSRYDDSMPHDHG
ncbi:cytochrome c oxidase subunit II [Asaia bogorensis]|uniref:cytochrome c oxidase subunit II n=1 Tax=Asaia bogorensis TaxID=91915 RepID=UPI000EFCC305|nr:ubiquinol oxidase subunit II [Asaia bogorensis]